MNATSNGWKKRPDHVGILLDRSVGDPLAVELAKIPKVTARTLADIYGPEEAQTLADVVFLAEAGQQGWIVLTQDLRMWRNPVEQAVIVDNGTQVFALGSAQLTAVGKGFVIGRRYTSIMRRHRRSGACFWRIYSERETKKDSA